MHFPHTTVAIIQAAAFTVGGCHDVGCAKDDKERGAEQHKWEEDQDTVVHPKYPNRKYRGGCDLRQVLQFDKPYQMSTY